MKNNINDVISIVMMMVPNDLDYEKVVGLTSTLLDYHLVGHKLCLDGEPMIKNVVYDKDNNIYVIVSQNGKDEIIDNMFNDIVNELYEKMYNEYDSLIEKTLTNMGLMDILLNSVNIQKDFLEYIDVFLKRLMDERLKYLSSIISDILKKHYSDVICDIDNIVYKMKHFEGIEY